MGLDITAYRKLTKVDVLFDTDGEPIDPQTREYVDCLKIFANPSFPGREEGLEDRACYTFEDAEHVFGRAYSAYNRWRERLAKMAGYPLGQISTEFSGVKQSHAAAAWTGMVVSGPFYELVNFADNEGVIGPVVAAKLLRDFDAFDEQAKGITEDYFYEGYAAIRHGLEMAADGGCLNFH